MRAKELSKTFLRPLVLGLSVFMPAYHMLVRIEEVLRGGDVQVGKWLATGLFYSFPEIRKSLFDL